MPTRSLIDNAAVNDRPFVAVGQQQQRFFRVTRRQFLSGILSSPLAAGSAIGAVVTPKESSRFELTFALSDDGSVLTVSERAVCVAPTGTTAAATTHTVACWRIPAAAFGPEAWFDLKLPVGKGASDYGVIVRQARFADRGGAVFELQFSQPSGKDSRWHLAWHCDLWRASPTPVALGAFLDGAARSTAHIPTSQAAAVLADLFDQRIRSAPGVPARCPVRLDRDLVWHVGSESEPAALTSFGDMVQVAQLEFAWSIGKQEAQVFLGGFARPRLSSLLIVGDAKAHRVVLSPAQDAAPTLELRRGKSPLFPTQALVVAALRLRKGSVAVHDDTGCIAGPVAASDLVLTQASWTAPHSGDARSEALLRTVLYGNALVAPAADAPADKPDADGKRPLRYRTRIISPVGPLLIGAPDLDIAIAASAVAVAETPAKTNAAAPLTACASTTDAACIDVKGMAIPETARAAAMRLFLAAVGDRIGAAASTVFVIHDATRKAGAPRGLRRIAIDVALLEAATALPDTSYSRLTFRRAALRLHFEDGTPLAELRSGEYPHPSASSFIWLGRRSSLTAASAHTVLDLSRAELTCARDSDLMKLRLRFTDLALAYHGDSRPLVQALRENCRLLVHDGVETDSRPLLLVEFDPQHVMEEAILRPEPLPLPDVEDPPQYQRRAVIKGLAELPDAKKRAEYRRKVLAAKTGTAATPRGAGAAEREAFKVFSTQFEAAATQQGLDEDQRIYLGAFALDPDAMALAREVHRRHGEATILATLKAMLADVDALAKSPEWRKAFAAALGTADAADFSACLRREAMLEQQVPLYAAFRDFWREQMVEARAPTGHVCGADYAANEQLELDPVVSADTRYDEYLSPFNQLLDDDKDRASMRARRAMLREPILQRFQRIARGIDPVCDLMEARLSGCSRLVFRINCEAVAGVSAEEAGLPSARPVAKDVCSGASKAAPRDRETGPVPGSGSDNYPAIDFTFEALTDWSRHELAVTRRARKVFEQLESGQMPPLGNRAANLSDLDMLRFQGFSEGSISAEQRLSEVRASLSVVPTAWETSIEVPARLILSTAQDALWRSTRALPPELVDPLRAEPPPPSDTCGETPPMQRYSGPRALWSARLMVDEGTSSLRVITSPDLRAGALKRDTADNPRLPHAGAPPRGPWAPWFIGPEQMESVTLDCNAAAKHLQPTKEVANAQEYAEKLCNERPALPRPGLIDWLFRRGKARGIVLAAKAHLFRTSLDANDRHQLVLLSSTYGLPVIGAREAVKATKKDASGDHDGDGSDGGNGDGEVTPGALVRQSGQFEPGLSFSLIDADEGQAIYRPVPLNVQQLALTSLGASFLHDTTFRPPAGADDSFGRKIFDGMSIERWQHDIVQGRDMRAEVVYKGYLLPFGHRASLVKLTERAFINFGGSLGLKAILRQRFFVRVATPRKVFPAIGQPHGGRMWCGKTVTILTVRTPDLLDPAYSIDGGPKPPSPGDADTHPEALNGRIHLPGTGLAFWPRTDITDKGLVMFDVDIDGAVTRLPMLFVDNIAATSDKSLAGAVDHYNNDKNIDNRTDRRIAVLGGQKISFAEEKKPGDTRYVTHWLRLYVHGRLRSEDGSWTGALSNFHTDSLLEGAEQPPFYPALEYAEIRLSQAERFSGGEPLLATVQYDGSYVRDNFPASAGSALPQAAAAAPGEDAGASLAPDLMLNLRKAVKLDMGGNGERSAAIARPHSYIIALSRTQGPLGGDDRNKVFWRLRNGSPIDEELLEGPADNRRPVDLQKKVFTNRCLVSLVPYFSTAGREKPTARNEQEKKDIAPATMPQFPPDSTSAYAKKLDVLKSYFSGDAKLLGTIRIKDLLLLLRLQGVDFPQLQEVVDYGSSIADEADTAANDLRTRALTPLHEAIGRLSRAWDKLDATLLEKQKDYLGNATVAAPAPAEPAPLVQPLSLKQVYVEVTQGLSSLDQQLKAALTADSVTSLPEQMAGIYQAARTLLRALNTLTSNPAERIEDALGASLRNSVSRFTLGMSELVTKVGDTLKETGAELVREKLTEFLLQQLPPTVFVELFSFLRARALDIKQLDALTGGRGIAVLAALKPVENKLDEILTQAGSNAMFGPLIKAMIEDALRHPDQAVDKASQAWKAALNEIREKLQARAGKALQTARDDLTQQFGSTPAAAAIDVVIQGYEAMLQPLDWSNLETADLIGAVSEAKTGAVQRVIAETTSRQVEHYVGLLRRLGAIAQAVDGVSAERARREIAAVLVATFLPMDITQLADVGKLTNAISVYLGAWKGWANKLFQTGVNEKYFADEVAWSRLANRSSIPADAGISLTKALRTLYGAVSSNTAMSIAVANAYATAVQLLFHLRAASQALDQLSAAAESGNSVAGADLRALVTSLQLLWLQVCAVRAALTQLAKHLKDLFGQLQAADATFVATLPVNGLTQLVKLALDLASESRAASQAINDLKAFVEELARQFAETSGVGVAGITSMLDLQRERETRKSEQEWSAQAYLDIGDPESVKQLLHSFVDADRKTRLVDLFTGGYHERVAALAARETRLYLDACGKLQRLRRLPRELTAALQNTIAKSDLFKVFFSGYASLRRTRDSLLDGLAQLPFTLAPAREVLSPKDEPTRFATCTCFDVGSGANDGQPSGGSPQGAHNQSNDLLWKEGQTLAAVLEIANRAAGVSGDAAIQAEQDAVGRNFAIVVASWTGLGRHLAAPLMMGKGLDQLIRRLLTGDILAVIDLTAFREQIEDAIASLIPARVRLAYDFASTIEHASDGDAIFQPETGARFGIHVRSVVDLLRPQKSDYHAYGEMGPFDIKLIGGLVDALRLKFGGAAFEVRRGEKARFDVIYKSFEIGKDLEFAKPLQEFLTPKDGNGVFIQPMTRGVGIEAGYGINLQTIGVGATSFFNVILSVSAELPFDDSESLFKVSLGRRLAPFSMSVVPFAGSGFFSIYCAADGVRGFEASFEFGGGGSIGFGPLTAVARIQVGVYVRVLKLAGRSSTTIYGTFFAGGSASIWIFHFATSLSVRLGQENGGAMYGEATYSFSFSLGLADFNYSVTAFHKESAIGQGGSSNRGGGGGRNDAREAYFSDPRLLPDDAIDAVADDGPFERYFDTQLIAGLQPRRGDMA